MLTPQLHSLELDLIIVLNPYGNTGLVQVLRLLALFLRCDIIWKPSPVLWIFRTALGSEDLPDAEVTLTEHRGEPPRQHQTYPPINKYIGTKLPLAPCLSPGGLLRPRPREKTGAPHTENLHRDGLVPMT